MAGAIEKQIESYHYDCKGISALQWSEDMRIALCTSKGIILLDLVYAPQQTEKKMCFRQGLIPCPSKPKNLMRFSLKQMHDWKKDFKGATPDDYHELILDRPLNPFAKLNIPYLAHRVIRWSSKGADPLGRCVLATLTLDHELCIFSHLLSRDTCTKVVDLSIKYKERFTEKINTDITFQEYRKLAHSIFAVEMAWSRVYSSSQVKYSLLAVVMKNLDLVLWKVRFPVLNSDDVEVLTVHNTLTSSLTKCMCWSYLPDDGQDLLITGHTDGSIYAHLININTGELKYSHALYEETDLMMVTCVGTIQLTKDVQLILATKEQYVIGYVVEIQKGRLQVHAHAVITGPHSLYCTDVCLKRNCNMLCTADGHIMKISYVFEKNKLTLTLSPVVEDCIGSWKALGVDVSPNGVLMAYLCWPTFRYEVRRRQTEFRPLQFVVIPLETDEVLKQKLELILLDSDKPCHEIKDILEMFRQFLWTGFDPIPSLTKHISNREKWISLPIKWLQLLRYFVRTIATHIPDVDENTDKEKALTKDNCHRLSMIIAIKQAEDCINKLLSKNAGDWSNAEEEVAGSIQAWLLTKEEYTEGLSVREKNLNVKPKEHLCCICDEKMLIEDFSVKCPNGHNFGLCCKTFTPCSLDYRVCVVCKAQAQGQEYLKGIPWIEMVHCVICDNLMMT